MKSFGSKAWMLPQLGNRVGNAFADGRKLK